MPRLIDATGQRFGRLVILSRIVSHTNADGTRSEAAWLCRCDCGNTEVIPARRLASSPGYAARRSTLTQCAECRVSRNCVVCGAAFASAAHRVVCGDACRKRREADQLQAFHARNPDYHRNWHAKLVARAQADPVFASRWIARQQADHARHMERLRTDAAYREQVRELDRQRGRLRRAAEAADPTMREQQRQKRRAWYAKMEPEQRRAYLQTMRDYQREYRRQRALRALMAVGDRLMQRRGALDDPTSTDAT